MSRTTTELVQAVLVDDYDGVTELTPYIDSAYLIMNRVITCANEKEVPLTTAEAEMTERWLAAHFYAVRDKPYMSRSTGGASGSFGGSLGEGLYFTQYGQMATRIDASGCLENIDKTQVASLLWLGKAPSAQTDYTDRN